MEVGGEAKEIVKFCTGTGSSSKTVTNVVEEELGTIIRVGLEQVLFHIPNQKVDVAGADTCACGYILDQVQLRGAQGEVVKGEDKLDQAEESVSQWGLKHSVFKKAECCGSKGLSGLDWC